ncbi:MAG TPA: condensation domain-containing protein [Bryobacteraceae bacterium]|nr:condensation domain-containing protein [Bryobacteraceae bacterium]
MPGPAPLSDQKRNLLEKYLRGELGHTAAKGNGITRRPPGEAAPLSLTQQELWFRELRVPDIPPLYNECVTLHMKGPLDVAVLEHSFTEIVRRHEAWRTTFETVDGQPVQVIQPASKIKLQILDLRKLGKREQEAEAVRCVARDAQRPFDLRRGLLLRPTLVKLDDAEHRLYLIAHQIILDGKSAYQIFPSELAALYKAFSAGRPSPLPELPVQCADFAYWQRKWLQGDVLAKQVDYWRKQLPAGLPVLHWPNDKPRPAARTFRGAFHAFALPGPLTEALRELSRRASVTFFMTLLAGFTALLHSYTLQEDIVVGTLSPSGRKRTEVQALLGYFLNPVALRMNFENDSTFNELLLQVRGVLSEAISHDDVPLEYLAWKLKPERDPSRSPFFTVAMSLQPPAPDLDLDWSVTSMDVESGGASWDLYIAFIDRPNGMIGRAQYNPDQFELPTITAMLDDLRKLLESAALNPEQRVSELRQVIMPVRRGLSAGYS